jgi:hypothetical protein
MENKIRKARSISANDILMKERKKDYFLRLQKVKSILPPRPIKLIEGLYGEIDRKKYYDAWHGRSMNFQILEEFESFAKKHYSNPERITKHYQEFNEKVIAENCEQENLQTV